ncbi:MAG: helix-turn-helix transcriptional regulator [Mucilaginibacter sp.]|nr:helix-turn-helix transcriptional regulator [Mucilaginibacter sp.]
MSEICQTIKTLRQQRHWSQQEMASKVGITLPAFSRIENNVTEITFTRAKKIARVLGISLAALFNHGEEPAPVTSRTIRASRSKLKLREKEVLTIQRKLIEMYGLLKDHAETAR